MRPFALILFFCLAASLMAGAQGGLSGFSMQPDTIPDLDPDVEYVEKKKANLFKGKPGRAALYSLILPGAGQVYNGKVWKVPLVYAAIGTAGYFVIDNSSEYRKLRDGYIERLQAIEEGRTPTDAYYMNPENGTLSPESIRFYRDQFNRYRQISIFVLALTWIANSAEAFVDAHLTDFDINDDISLHVRVPDSRTTLYTQVLQAGVTYNF